MPFVKVIVHAVWATKDRKPFLTQENRIKLLAHIREYASCKNIRLLNINGYTDHLHTLLSLSSDQNIATIMNLIKGESSFWANKNLKFNEPFGWQNEYFAVSVSASQFDAVNQYITNQEVHYSKKTWQNEYDAFLKEIMGLMV